jgi:enoyl-CoA hydratase/carnithine racemase
MLSTEYRDDVAWITIDRPEQANAVSLEGWRAMAEALHRAGDEARVAVLTGAGGAFSAGDDIGTLAAWEDADDIIELSEAVYEAYHAIEQTPVPVIAAIDGVALGGGLELVIGSDLAVATEGSTFSLPEGRIGGYPPFAVERIRRSVGRKRMMELALTGERIDAETAREWGFLNRVVPADDLAAEVESLVDAICLSPKRSVRLTKHAANRDIQFTAERERMIGAFAELFLSGDLTEGVEAFMDGSEPAWRS